MSVMSEGVSDEEDMGETAGPGGRDLCERPAQHREVRDNGSETGFGRFAKRGIERQKDYFSTRTRECKTDSYFNGMYPLTESLPGFGQISVGKNSHFNPEVRDIPQVRRN